MDTLLSEHKYFSNCDISLNFYENFTQFLEKFHNL